MSRFTGRALDRIWFIFFAFHIPITLLVDTQGIQPPSLVAKFPFAQQIVKWYLSWSRDPIVQASFTGGREWNCLYIFFHLELFVQLPIFIIGAWCLWHNDKRVYPLLIFYGSMAFTCTLPVVAAVLDPETVSPPLTTSEKINLLASYVPWLIIPPGIALDMGLRLYRILDVRQKGKTI